MLSSVRKFLERIVRFFYPVIAVSGAHRIPSAGSVVVVSNHPNGLIDPVTIGLGLARPVAFLAKGTLFGNPVSRLLMDAFGAIPVYRAVDGQGTGRNQETFAICRKRLLEGGWIAIFPEGTTHDDPAMKPFKTGAARIALEAQADAGDDQSVKILPVGLLYEDKHIFRSRLALSVGEPIDVREQAREAPADPKAAAEHFTAVIHEALGAVTLEAENRELWRGFMAVAAWTDRDADEDLALRETRARSLARAYRQLVTADPLRAGEVVDITRRFVRMLQSVGIDDPLHLEGSDRPTLAALAGSLFSLLMMAPVALVGAVLSWIPYRLVKPLAHLAAGGKVELIGTFKVLIGLVIMTITYVTEAVLFGSWFGWPVGLATLVIAPATGFIALRFHERLSLRREALRAYWLRSTRARVAVEIRKRRRELARLVEVALKEVLPESAGSSVEPGANAQTEPGGNVGAPIR
ncbi:MAG: lysophospholipid acyltransferase family protein [Deltaproteobacteria bacterium]|nr:lysophospholipid acyltransferase family protein [Deltaproteobacteria bacterium]